MQKEHAAAIIQAIGEKLLESFSFVLNEYEDLSRINWRLDVDFDKFDGNTCHSTQNGFAEPDDEDDRDDRDPQPGPCNERDIALVALAVAGRQMLNALDRVTAVTPSREVIDAYRATRDALQLYSVVTGGHTGQPDSQYDAQAVAEAAVAVSRRFIGMAERAVERYANEALAV